MYTISFQPTSKIEGAGTGKTTAKTANEALKIVEGLAMSDERVTIHSSAEGEIDIHFLRVLAKEEDR